MKKLKHDVSLNRNLISPEDHDWMKNLAEPAGRMPGLPEEEIAVLRDALSRGFTRREAWNELCQYWATEWEIQDKTKRENKSTAETIFDAMMWLGIIVTGVVAIFNFIPFLIENF